MYDIITAGSATVDVFANTHSQLVKFVTNDGEDDYIAYPSGSKILIKNLTFLVGGGGTNTAVSFSRLGCKTAYLGNIGLDANSHRVLDLLKDEQIDFIGTRSGQTGYSIILDSIEQDRTILTFKGANDELSFEEINKDQFDAKWFYSSSLTGNSQETLRKLVHLAYEKHIKIAFNPSNYQATLGYEALKDILERCTVLVMNKEEANLLFNQNNQPELFSHFLSEHKSAYVVITDGAKGAICHHDDEQCTITPSPHLSVVETTGAGDAFASGFVAGLFHHLPLADAMKLGMVQAESVIQSIGAKESLLLKEVAFSRIGQFQGTISFQKEEQRFTSPKQNHLLPPQFYEAEPERGFRFDTGQNITSLEELGYYLEFMSDEQFNKHVSIHHNHFADWVEHVFSLSNLANQLRKLPIRKAQSSLIINFVHKGGNP
ncbi:MAG: carbohydrate kinase family protein [Nanoarchaeota archaeon]|nr:carbohydrate kinase family protein [Nanoarchaeota archaeon]